MIYIRTMNIAPNRLDRAETGKFVGVRRLKSIPTVLFVHSLGNDLIHRKP